MELFYHKLLALLASELVGITITEHIQHVVFMEGQLMGLVAPVEVEMHTTYRVLISFYFIELSFFVYDHQVSESAGPQAFPGFGINGKDRKVHPVVGIYLVLALFQSRLYTFMQ